MKKTKKTLKPVLGICAGLLIAAGLIAGCEFSIDTMKVKSVKLPAEALSFPKYGERLISAVIVPDFAENLGVSWESDNPGIVEVTQGAGLEAALKGISAGQAVITVTTADGNKQASVQVTIEQPPVQTLTVRNMKTEITEGTTADTENLFTWDGETATAQTTTTGTLPLRVTNKETNAHVGSVAEGRMPDSTLVYVKDGVPASTPFTWRGKMYLEDPAAAATSDRYGVFFWVNTDPTVTPTTMADFPNLFKYVGVRRYTAGTNSLRRCFPDSGSGSGGASQMRNISSGTDNDGSAAMATELAFEIKWDGIGQYDVTIDGIPQAPVSQAGDRVGARTLTLTAASPYSSATQKPQADLFDTAKTFYPGFHVSGATVVISELSLIKGAGQ